MKLLKCKYCAGEVEIIGNERAINKKIKCLKCGYTNLGETERKGPEVVIIKKRPIS
jgi:hypothetical protein